MNTYYVSLVKDLIGYYLKIEADCELTVRKYLCKEYREGNIQTLPWCSIYSSEEIKDGYHVPFHVIKASCGTLYDYMFVGVDA